MAEVIQHFFGIKNSEWKKSLLMSLYFFLVIAVFWILKPIKKAMLVTHYTVDNPLVLFNWTLVGGEAEQVAKVLNMLVAFVASVIFAYLSKKFVRQTLVVVVHLFFVITLYSYARAVEHPTSTTAWSFYLFGDLWSTLNVALFFAFLNDLVNTDQAKRLYGMIGLGGVLGGAVGSNFSGFFIKSLGAPTLLLVSVGFNILIIAIAVSVGKLSRTRQITTLNKNSHAQITETSSSITDGFKLILSSPYLFAIMGMVGLYEIVSTIMDFQFTQGVIFKGQELGWDREATSAFFGKVFGVTNILAIFIQFFITGFVMRRFGIGVALLVMPMAATLSSFGFLALPMLYTAASLSVVDNGFNYSINQSAKEALYVPTSENAKYRAKSFIDIFVQRFAKTIGVALNLIIPTIVGSSISGVRWLSVASLILLGMWIALARFAGKEFSKLSENEKFFEETRSHEAVEDCIEVQTQTV